MIFGLTFEVDQRDLNRSIYFGSLDALLSDHFKDRSFGFGVDSILIGIILTDFPQRRFRYQRDLKVKNIFGTVTEFGNTIAYDLKVDYEICMDVEERMGLINLSTEILKSTEILEKHREKYPQFSVEEFVLSLRSALVDFTKNSDGPLN